MRKVLMALRKRPKLVWTIGTIAFILIAAGVLFGATRTEPIDSFTQCAEDGNPITESEPPVCQTGNRYFIGPLHATPVPETLGESVSAQGFDILVEGDSGGDYPRRQEVIRDDATWQQYWTHVHTSPYPPLIPVNFGTSSVIAISEGRQETTGYNYRVNGVATGSRGTIVDITESIPTVTCNVTSKTTNRYFIVRTPKLTDPVSFRTTTEYRHCD
jgi:hypothetical protein